MRPRPHQNPAPPPCQRDSKYLFGTVTPVQSLSRPVLTVVLAAAERLQPCAMWVLVFLIGLLLNVTSRARRWLLGASFPLASAGVYFLIMAAWLNTLLLLGALPWLRLLIGAVAIGTGLWALRDFRRGELVCATSQSPVRRTVLERLRTRPLRAPATGHARHRPAGLRRQCGGTAVLGRHPGGLYAVSALGALPAWQHYPYLALYVLIFMVDDLLIFGAAMLTIETTSPGARYSCWSKLIWRTSHADSRPADAAAAAVAHVALSAQARTPHPHANIITNPANASMGKVKYQKICQSMTVQSPCPVNTEAITLGRESICNM